MSQFPKHSALDSAMARVKQGAQGPGPSDLRFGERLAGKLTVHPHVWSEPQ